MNINNIIHSSKKNRTTVYLLRMLSSRTSIILFILLFSIQTGTAQVSAPDFLCVRNDTLFWNNVPNNCGVFNAYNIFTSENEDGPFTLLEQVTDPTQDFYYDNVLPGTVVFYYLTADFNCPGQEVLTSDTLDNLLPPAVEVLSATVNGTETDITWLPSTAPETGSYIVYRETATGVQPVATVDENTFAYTDVTGDPTSGAESFYVLAEDNCGGVSIFGAEHRTVFLEIATADCEDFVTLNWTEYLGWEEGVDNYEIWVSNNGDAPELAEVLSGETLNFNFPQPDNLVDYCFTVIAREANGSNSSASNEACIFIDIIQPVRDFSFTDITVNPDNSVRLDWQWGTNADITAYDINRSTDFNAQNLLLTENITPPLTAQNTFLDDTANPETEQLYYTVTAGDACGNVGGTEVGSPIFLSGTATPSGQNQLSWTELLLPGAETASYEIFRIEEGNPVSVGTTDGQTFTFTDAAEIAPDAPVACYFIRAAGEVTLYDESTRGFVSNSPRICVEQNSRLFLPNAFAPNGVNREFRAVVLFPETVDFEMQIYDRYGKQIFVTTDPQTGWNGELDGRIAPQGVYVFHARVTQTNGRVIEEQGTFLLVK